MAEHIYSVVATEKIWTIFTTVKAAALITCMSVLFTSYWCGVRLRLPGSVQNLLIVCYRLRTFFISTDEPTVGNRRDMVLSSKINAGRLVMLLSLALCLKPFCASAQETILKTTSQTKSVTIDGTIEYISTMNDGLVVVYTSDGITYICSDKGEIVKSIKNTEHNYAYFSNGVAVICMKKDNSLGSHPYFIIVDKTGKTIQTIDNGGKVSQFVDGVAYVSGVLSSKEHEYYIDITGKKVYNGKLFDTPPSAVISSNPRKVCDGLRMVAERKDGYSYFYGFIDKDGKTIIPAKYIDAHDFSEGLAAVKFNDSGKERWIFIDTKGNQAINLTFEKEPGDFHEGLCQVKKTNGKWVYIDRTGKVISPEYFSSQRFMGGYAYVCREGYHEIIDKSFSMISKSPVYHPTTPKFYPQSNSIIDGDGSSIRDNKYGKVISVNGSLSSMDGKLFTVYGKYTKNANGVFNLNGEYILKIEKSEF